MIFIEGLSKDANPHIRKMCALGLSLIGASTIRTLLNGLLDPNVSVRREIESHLVNRISIDQVMFEYKDNVSLKHSLKVTVKDLIDNYIYPMNKQMIGKINTNTLNSYEMINKFSNMVKERKSMTNQENKNVEVSNFFSPNTQKFLINLHNALENSIVQILKKNSATQVDYAEFFN